MSDRLGGLKIRMKTVLRWKPEPVLKAAETAGEKALAKLASFVWTKAHQSIRNKKASPPGTAMGRGSGFMRDSLVVQRIDNRELHIGFFRGSRVGDLHEWGGTVGRKRYRHGVREAYMAKYPPRPTMRLALEKSQTDFERKFPEEFAKYFGAGGRATMGETV